MNWLEAYVLYPDEEDCGIEFINLGNVQKIMPSAEDRYQYTEIIYTDGSFILIKGFYKDIRDLVHNLKDGESAFGQFDYDL